MTSLLTNWEIYVLKAAERTNLITNPSFETNTTGYTTVNSTIAASVTQKIRGLNSLAITPSSTSEAGVYYGLSCTSGQPYYFSCDVFGEAGKTYTLRITNASDTQKATVSFTGTGFWQRRSLSFTADATATFRFKLLRDGSQSTTAVFYTDGWQVENAATESSYIDGDLDTLGYGFLRDIVEYRWNGTAHGATSTRISDTRSGGTYLRLRTYTKAMTFTGLGMTGYDTVSTEMVKGDNIYQWSRPGARQFVITLQFDASAGGGTPGNYHQALAQLQAALQPDGVRFPQLSRLLFIGFDSTGTECTERILVDCIYKGGLESAQADYYMNQAVLTFEQPEHSVHIDGNPGKALTYQVQQNFYSLASLDLYTGAWSAEGISATGAVADNGVQIAFDSVGGFYLAGTFTNQNGDANQDNIAYRNAAGTWSALGSGLSASAFAVVVHPDGTVYIGGNFDNAGGDANADHICKWNGAALSAVNASFPNDWVYALCVAANGYLYAGGSFTAVGAIANTARIAYWTGSAWTSLGTEPDGGSVTCIIPDPSSNGVIIAGTFTNAGGTAANDFLVRYNGSAYSLIGSAAPDNYVYSIIYDDTSGRLYAFGDFHNIGGVAALHAAYWDGSNWYPIAGLSASAASNQSFGLLPNGNIIIPNAYVSACMYSIYNGSILLPVDLVPTGVSTLVRAAKYNPSNNKIYFCGDLNDAGNTYIPGVTQITNSYGDCYPTVAISGPGTVYSLKNFTTGQEIYFTGLTLLAGELIYLKFNPTGLGSFTSTVRGNMYQYIAPGSSPTLKLRYGTNNISLFIYGGTTAATGASIVYPDGYQSLDVAVIR